MNEPIWLPDDDALQNSGIAKWMKDRGDSSFSDFRHWSLENRSEFWQQAAERMGIVWQSKPGTVLRYQPGDVRAEWFPGGKLNIAESCFQGEEDCPAIITGDPEGNLQTVSRLALFQKVRKIAGALKRAGFISGDAIGVVLPMTPEAIALYLGIIYAGCHAVSIADSFAPPEIANRLRIANAKVVFTHDVQMRAGKRLPLYERVRAADQTPAIVMANDGEKLSVELAQGDRTWFDFVSGAPSLKEAAVCESESIINVLFSSGTTGDPKAIPWTQLTPLKCAVDGLIHQDIRPRHVVAWPTSLGWMMGPWLIFAALINRATIGLYLDAPMGQGFGRFVQDAKVNMLGVVPTIVRAWRESRCMERFNWSSIHTFSSTGESSRADDMRYLSGLAGGRPVIEYCGGTEIGGGYISQTVLEANYAAAFSTPAAGLDFFLIDGEGAVVNEGEVFLVPPSCGLSNRLLNRDHTDTYFPETPSCPESESVGGIRYPAGTRLRRHGDHFRRLENGFLVAGGRVDDTMNLGGIKTSSAEIERVLNLVPGIRETAAIAWNGGDGPDELHVFHVLDGKPLPDDLLREMNQRLKSDLNPLFRVSAIHAVDALPRTASNKVMRRLLRDRLG